MIKIAIVGCGYLGARLAKAYLKSGASVSAIVRSQVSAEKLQSEGVEVRAIDLDDPEASWPDMSRYQLFYFVPPPRQGVEDDRAKNLLSAFDRSGLPAKVVFLSTTGVYGDCHGDWVDEDRPVAPSVDRAKRRWDGEQQARAWSEKTGVPLVVLRVAGIYGPNKIPLARLKREEPLVAESEAPYTNRIYIDDLVTVCQAAMDRGVAGEVYNVSDGHPGNMTDYFNRVADFAGLPRPDQLPLQEARQQLSAGMLSYLGESRRLDNSKMLEQLQVQLACPTLQLGLEAIAKAETSG